MNKFGKLLLVLFALSVCATATLLNYLHRTQQEIGNSHEIYKVVAQQFESFRHADYLQAYNRTTNTVQAQFNPDEFEAMIRMYYPSLEKANRIEFGSVNKTREGVQVKVYFIDTDGVVTACLYSLMSEQGQWKIDNVKVLTDWPKRSRLTGLRV